MSLTIVKDLYTDCYFNRKTCMFDGSIRDALLFLTRQDAERELTHSKTKGFLKAVGCEVLVEFIDVHPYET